VVICRVRATPGGVDAYGDPVASTSTSVQIRGAFVAPRQTDENNDPGRAGVTVGLNLYAPPGTDLVHTDQVTVDGDLFDLDGEVADWVHPGTGWTPGLVVALSRAQG
jgi:hypothetical protein